MLAPRPTRCAVCSSSMARCYVCHRRRPYKRVWATFDVAHIAGRKITFVGVVGALYPCERRLPFPPCLRAFPHCGAQSASPSFPPAARRIAECANARPKSARFRYRRFLFGRGAGRAHSPRFSLRRLHPTGVRASCGRARPATQAAEPVNFHRSGVADGLAQAARGLLPAECGCRGVYLQYCPLRGGKIISIGNYCAVTGEEIPR